MGVKGKTNQAYTKNYGNTSLSEDINTDTVGTSTANRTGTRRAVFDSQEGQNLLRYLSGETSRDPGLGTYGSAAGAAYGALASDHSGGNNPFIDEIVSRSNAEGDRFMSGGLAKVRAQGFRGGTGANMYGQARLVADTANSRARDNAAFRSGAYEAAQGRALTGRLAGASGLAGLESTAQSSRQASLQQALQLLAMLRGEDINDTAVTNSNSTSTSRRTNDQRVDNKTITLGHEGEFKWGF